MAERDQRGGGSRCRRNTAVSHVLRLRAVLCRRYLARSFSFYVLRIKPFEMGWHVGLCGQQGRGWSYSAALCQNPAVALSGGVGHRSASCAYSETLTAL